MGMLKLCGMGIAIGNAIQEVKDIADVVIKTNDNEGIADFLVKEFDLWCRKDENFMDDTV